MSKSAAFLVVLIILSTTVFSQVSNNKLLFLKGGDPNYWASQGSYGSQYIELSTWSNAGFDVDKMDFAITQITPSLISNYETIRIISYWSRPVSVSEGSTLYNFVNGGGNLLIEMPYTAGIEAIRPFGVENIYGANGGSGGATWYFHGAPLVISAISGPVSSLSQLACEVMDHPELNTNCSLTIDANISGYPAILHGSIGSGKVIILLVTGWSHDQSFPGNAYRGNINQYNNLAFLNNCISYFGGGLPGNNYGTTVLVHGLNANISNEWNTVNYWPYQIEQEILTRVSGTGNGSIYLIQNGEINSLKNPPTSGETVILFDWLETSKYPVFGYAEAAGDALAALLIKGAQEGKWNLEQLHFIGHSRGAVVSSEAIERLALFSKPILAPNGIEIDQNIHLTTLDPHPWDNTLDPNLWDPFTAYDNFTNGLTNAKSHPFNGGVIAWENVKYVDNYWHMVNPLAIDLGGLPNFQGCENNKNLTETNGQYIGIDHSLIKYWYMGTITNYNNGETSWYPNNEINTLGFNKSKSVNGSINSIRATNPVSIDVDPTLNENTIFNGNFNKRIIDIESLQLIYPIITLLKLPGWYEHGGSGLGIDGYPFFNSGQPVSFNPCLLLSGIFMKSKTNNFFYIPKNKNSIYFNYRLLSFPRPGYDKLKILIDDDLVKEIPLDGIPLISKESSIDVESYSGSSHQITFEVTNNNILTTTSIGIDDIGFERASYLNLTAASPVNIHAYDSQNNHTGRTSEQEWETSIPGSDYYEFDIGENHLAKTITLPKPENSESYTFRVEAIGEIGSCDIYIEDTFDPENHRLVVFEDLPIFENTEAKMSLSFADKNLNILIDKEGDGEFESYQVPTRVISNSLPIKIDIKPNSFPNVVNRVSQGVLPVSILTTSVADGDFIDFDASSVDVQSISFGPNEAMTKTNCSGHLEDVDSDGDLDLMLHFNIQDIGLECGLTDLFLSATTTDGLQILGLDQIEVLGCLGRTGEPYNKVPLSFNLTQNYPNPFNPSTKIQFSIPEDQYVTVKVYDILGKEVGTLVNEEKQAGYYSVEFNGNDLSSGIYIYQIHAGKFLDTKKMILMK